LQEPILAIVAWILGSLVAVVILVFAWGVWRLRKSSTQVRAELAKLKVADVGRLRDDCRRAFREAFSEDLDLGDFEASASLLSRRIDDGSLKQALMKDDFWWYYVLPAGAVLGELMRLHAQGEWKDTDDGAPEMRIPVGDGEATTYPFDEVFKQVTVGDKGDLHAYLVASRQLEKAAARPGA
jgi:hypothetical protein